MDLGLKIGKYFIGRLAEKVETGSGKRKPTTKELTPLGAYINTYFKYISDQDKILKYKAGGKGRQFYDDMIDDDGHIKACITSRKTAVASLGYEIQPYVAPGMDEPEDRDIEIANNITEILLRAKNFDNDIYEMLSALNHGYSVGEIMYRIDSDYIVIEDILSRQVDSFSFNKDYELVYKALAAEEKIMEAEKFVVATFDPRNENPYGTSLLRSCYWPYWFKTNIIKFQMLFTEKFGQPTIVGKYPAGWGQPEIDKLVDELESVQSNTSGAIQEGTEVSFLESQSRKESEFLPAIEFFDRQASKAILGQTLTTDEGQKSGSYALGKVHHKVRLDLVEADAKGLQSIIQDQVINRLCDYNGYERKPRFIIPFKEPEDLESTARYYETLSKFKVEFPKQHIHNKFGIPMPQEGEEVYGGKSPAPPSPFGGGGLEFTDKGKRKFHHPVRDFGRLVGVRPTDANTYDIATNLTFYDDMAAVIRRAFADVQRQLMTGLSADTPMYGLIDQAVRLALDESFEYQIAKMKGDTVISTANLFSDMFGLGKIEKALRQSVFEQIKNEYLTKEFYAKGKIRGISNTMRNILQNKIPQWREIGFDVGQMKSLLKSEFTKMADWKVHQIAQTELSNAAHHTAFEMIEQTGLEFEAWFFVDPASCEICQGIAANNPYTVQEAKAMGLPHIQCNDQWSFTAKKKAPVGVLV